MPAAAMRLIRRSSMPNTLERRAWIWWDTVTLLNAGSSELVFFRDIQGKTPQQTNMVLSSQIPFPQVFACYALQIKPALGTTLIGPVVPLALTDYAILARARVDFAVGTVDAFQTILPLLPAGGGIHGSISMEFGAASGNVNFAQNGMPSPTFGHRFKVPVRIVHGENFAVRIRYPAAVTPSVDIPIQVRALGILGRGIQ